MALSVRSVTGKTFRRAGLAFSSTPVIVEDDVLAKPVEDRPSSYPPKTTVQDALMAEPNLACTPVEGETTPSEGKTTPSENGEVKPKARK
jgi:hypothetical protein